MSESLDLGAFRGALLTRELGRRLDHRLQASSTNDLAMAAAVAGAEHGLVVVAEEQTRGRGRGGNVWLAPPGQALLFSLVLRPGLSAAAAPQVTLAAAVAICVVLRDGGIDAHIKWPNDVLVGREKIAGILCESRARGERIEAVVAGIGINVEQRPEELPPGATSLRVLTGGGVERAWLLAAVLNELEPLLARLDVGRFAEVRAQWEELAPWHRGGRLRVDGEGGQLEGMSLGLSDDGALRLRRDDGQVIELHSGTVRFVGLPSGQGEAPA